MTTPVKYAALSPATREVVDVVIKAWVKNQPQLLAIMTPEQAFPAIVELIEGGAMQLTCIDTPDGGTLWGLRLTDQAMADFGGATH
jgi:hypothetical protein